MGPAKSTKSAGITDAAVKKATGKTWKQWITALDKAGCRKLDHKSIAKYVNDHFDAGEWWGQMVTVGYEQATGKRLKHEKPGGFEISSSKVVDVPVPALFKAWASPASRSKWLKDGSVKLRTSRPNKSMRFSWTDGEQLVSVNFYDKGNGKSQVALQHGKLPDTKAAEKMKTYWGKTLQRLKASLEG
jgi:uncharacterized protein YndB with AHSA1/START domain